MNRVMRFFLVLATVYMSICLMLFPKEGTEVAHSTVLMCINSVIPALLPYIICSGFLADSGLASVLSRTLSPVMKPLFGVPGSGAIALVLGTVSGYPIGAVSCCDLYQSGECSRADAERLLAFCNNSGPVFIMSMVGVGIFQSPHIGRLLYISHVMSALLVGIIMRTYTPRQNILQRTLPKSLPDNTKSVLRIFGGVMDNSVFSILRICGFILFFSVFAASLPKTGFLPYIHALLEITGGVRAVAALSIDFELKMCLISFFIAFSGISVLFQVGAVAAAHGLSLAPYIFGKLVQGIFSAILTKILISRLPQTVDVFLEGNRAAVTIPSAQESFAVSLAMLCFGLLVLALWAAIVKLCRKG